MRRRAGGSVYLIGAMGSGKTSVGRALARRLGWGFLDTDAEIERRAGRSIAALFEKGGEPSFRRLEREAVAAEARGPRRVISLGGGAVTDPKTAALLKRTGTVVYLQVSAPAALRRVEAEGIAKRPLFKGLAPSRRLGFLRRLIARRRASYIRCADMRVRSSGGNPENIARRLASRLKLS